VLFVLFAARGQCPEKKLLLERIQAIHSSSKLTFLEQITALHKYVDTVKNCPYKNDSTHAYLLRLIGSKYGKLGHFFTAVQYFHQSINMIVSNAGKPSINQKHLILSYFWLFSYYDSLNNVSEKMKAVDQCIDVAFKYNSSSDLECVLALYVRVKYFFDIGDYHKCIETAIMCEKLALEYARHGNVTAASDGKLIASSSLGWHVKALTELKHFEQAEKLLANKPQEYSKKGFKNNLGLIHEQLAQVYINKGDYNKALISLNQALKHEQNVGNNFNSKQVMKAIGYNVYFKHYRDNEKALFYLKNALAYTNRNKFLSKVDSFESMNILGYIANVYVQQELYDSASVYFQLAFNQIKPGIDETYFLKNSPEELKGYKKIHYLTSLIIDKGDAFLKKYATDRQRGDAQRALEIYKVADHVLNRIKTEQSDLESKLFWRSDSRRLYEHAIDACYLQGNTKDAFYFFEKSRAVLLNDQLIAQRYLGTEDILKEVQVKKEVIALERELASISPTATKYGEVLQKRFELRQQQDRLEQLIKVKNPLYYQTSLDTNFITIQYVQDQLLKDHQAMLEIFSGDSAVYSLLITPGKVYLNKISKADYDKTISSYISYISNRELLNKDFQGYTRTAYHLYELIFGKNPLPTGRIIVSPDGRYFPFEALITKEGSQDYFLNDHAVSYSYSARYLQNNFISNASVAAAGSFLGVAPVQYPHNSSLNTLTGSDLSLNKIMAFVGSSNNLVGAQASKDNFLKRFSSYKIIQLYTHASESSNHNEPVIYFADSSLYLSDLLPEKTPATQLIVLSACETGIGKLYQGEGIFSFSRGFAAFGVPSSMSTLWSVDDLSTYTLTELFYKYLAKDMPVDIALQKAKLEFIKSSSKAETLPYYWAATVLVGKTDPIKFDNPVNWRIPILISGIAGLLLLTVCIHYFRRKKPVFHRKELPPYPGNS
jgi:CHAT domain-containing protein